MKETKCILREAKAAVSSLAVLKSEENKAPAMADALIADTSSILCENKDMDAAKTLYLLSCSTGLLMNHAYALCRRYSCCRCTA